MASRASRKRRSQPASPRLSSLSRALLAVVIVGSVMAIGSVHIPVLLVVSVVATAAGACAIASAMLPADALAPVVLLAGVTLLTLLQIVPLPLWLLERLSPAGAEVWARALIPFAEGPPSWAPLSLDPGATLVEALKLWTYLGVFLAACVAGARRGAVWGAMLLGGSALALAVVALGHAASDATRVFGLYTPQLGRTGHGVAPLINPNNLAGYVNLGILCVLSLAAMARPPIPRWLLVLGMAPMLSMSLLTGSRGGLVSLVIASVLLLVLMRRASQNSLALPVRWKAFASVGSISLLVGMAFVIVAGGSRVWHLLLDDNLTKLSVAAASAPMIRDYWLTGIGRGAFEGVFPAYHTGVDNGVFAHPENFLVQLFSEWGAPGALLVCVAGAWLLRPSTWGIHRSLPACGLFCGVMCVGLQNLVDLSSEIPGVAIAVCAAAGFARGHRFSDRPTWGQRPLVGGVAFSACGLALMAVVFGQGYSPISADRELALAEMPTRRSSDGWHRFKRVLHKIVQRHPAEPYFYRLGAIAAWRTGEPPMPWIQLALERGLNAGRTHYLLGSYLASLGRQSQALFELRRAIELDPQLVGRAAKRAVALTTDRAQLARVVPEHEPGNLVLVALAKELRDRSCADALAFVRETVKRAPNDAATHRNLARWLLGAADNDKGDCEPRAALLGEAERHLIRSGALDGSSGELPILRARVLMSSERPQEALQLLKRSCQLPERRSECLTTWIKAAIQARDAQALREVAPQALAEGCSSAAGCGKTQSLLGDAARSLGEDRLALSYYEEAAAADSSPKRWRQVAKLAVDLGELGRAQRALDNAAALAPGDKAVHRELEALRRRMLLRGP